MNKPKPRFVSLEDYFKHKKPAVILDFITDLRSIGNACGMHRSEVRANLPKYGYHKSETSNGIRCWRLQNGR
jgi:hypothetical protein